MRPWMVVDVSTAPISNIAEYLTPADQRSAPENYKDEAKIAAYKQKSFESERLAAATDIDLAQITGLVAWDEYHGCFPMLTRGTDTGEQELIGTLADRIKKLDPVIITFAGFAFDLPLLERRARYLGIGFPDLNTDKYRSDHIDLANVLSDRGKRKARSLGWYVRRLGWTDLSKPLHGEEEATILAPTDPRVTWEALSASLLHDAVAVARLSTWLGIGTLPHLPTAGTHGTTSTDATEELPF